MPQGKMARLARRFFEGYTPKVARALLGTVLVRVADSERLAGIIVETEAYRGARDPASHAYRGRTRRNDVMFGEGGHAYVYFSYGSHWCLNVTTEPAGRAGAVLVRAIEPMEGLEKMLRNRGLESDEHLTDGPGKLTQALKIDSALSGEDLVTSDRLFLEEGERVEGVQAESRGRSGSNGSEELFP
jgi:DNA-3-methyladenine glycosylase